VTARTVLLARGGHTAKFILSTDTGPVFLLLPNMPKDFEARRLFAAQAVRDYATGHGATRLEAVFFVSEAWVTSTPLPQYEPADFVRPSEDPAKREVLVVVGRDVEADAPVRGWMGEIIRAHDKVEFAPWPAREGQFESAMIDAAESGWKAVGDG